MLLINAVALARMTTRNYSLGMEDIQFGTFWWFTYAGISCFPVLFAGIMSGLTLGLMSLGLMDLQILQRRRNKHVRFLGDSGFLIASLFYFVFDLRKLWMIFPKGDQKPAEHIR